MFPGPNLVGSRRQKDRLFVVWVAELIAPLSQLGMLLEDAIHGAHRAQVLTLIQQRRVDLRGGLVHESLRVQGVVHRLALLGRQGSR